MIEKQGEQIRAIADGLERLVEKGGEMGKIAGRILRNYEDSLDYTELEVGGIDFMIKHYRRILTNLSNADMQNDIGIGEYNENRI